MLQIALLIALIAAAAFAINAIKKYNLIRKKYEPVINLDEMVESLNKSLRAKQSELDELQAKHQEGMQRFNELQRHVNALEETANLLDFGLYLPHYDYDSSDKYKKAQQDNYEKQKELIRNSKAVHCPTEWRVNGSQAEGKKMIQQHSKLLIRAFNGECDACVAKVRWDNIHKMEERIRKSFEAINKSGQVNQISITGQFLSLKIEELRIAFEYSEKVKEEKDEQRRIQDEMREEEKARRDFERARIEAEREEERYQRALEKARQDMEKLSGEKALAMQKKIEELQRLLIEAHQAKERAISQAQLTKSGYVYVISNIGSFGEEVYKIGMTRRLDPMDRVRELGDASVPFTFDVHAMIYSENAPELENKLHKKFAANSVNLVNLRKEFFKVSLDEISAWATSQSLNIQITKLAEAKEYRQSQKIRNGSAPQPQPPTQMQPIYQPIPQPQQQPQPQRNNAPISGSYPVFDISSLSNTPMR